MPMSVVYTTVNGQILCENRGGVVHHFVSDPLGSVVMVRDNAGNPVYEAEYDPYGNVQSETGTNPSEFGYVGTLGYVKDSAFSLYVRARYLLTNLGRWLTKDPLWPSELGFVYAGAGPSMWVDPSGKGLMEAWQAEFNKVLEKQVREFFSCLNPDPDDFWDWGVWGYGKCCGTLRRCNASTKVDKDDCADAACRAHDVCVATWKEVPKWFSCNTAFCKELRNCWNKKCSANPAKIPRMCRAIQNIAWTHCRTRGTGMPGDLGSPWNPPAPKR